MNAAPRTARLYNKLGIAYHHQIMFDQARRNYERAVKLDQDFSQAINNLGTVYYAERKYKKAAQTYRKALQYSPDSASIYSNLGTALFARRKYKEATQAYLTALKLDPEVFEHRNSVGTLLQERSVQDRAQYYYFMAKAYASAQIYDRLCSTFAGPSKKATRSSIRFLKSRSSSRSWRTPSFRRWWLPGSSGRSCALSSPWHEGTPLPGLSPFFAQQKPELGDRCMSARMPTQQARMRKMGRCPRATRASLD